MHKQNLLLIAIMFCMSFAANAQSVLGYEPQADAFEQYHEAIARAEAENKLVLVVAGGDWCPWCYKLNQFVKTNGDVRRNLEDTFVVVKVYVGDENYNEFFFSQLPEARGAPHFWVISPEKHVLSSQPTADFESGKKGYDKAEFLGFIDHWKQHTRHAHVQSHAAVTR